jgi:hypothetical protein
MINANGGKISQITTNTTKFSPIIMSGNKMLSPLHLSLLFINKTKDVSEFSLKTELSKILFIYSEEE